MPPVARPRGHMPSTKLAVPRKVAVALRPELDREGIPSPVVTLSRGGIPFSKELREETDALLRKPVNPGDANIVVATLRRPWTYVGFMVDPGNATGAIVASLRALSRGGPAIVPGSSITISPGDGPTAAVAVPMGIRCELVLSYESPGEGIGPAKGVRGALWGMSDR